MKTKIDYSENKNKMKIVRCFCNNCKITTNHKIVTDYFEKGEELEEYGTSWQQDYQIIKCDNCNEVSFRIDGWFSEYCDYSPDGNDGTYEELYPESEKNIRIEKKYKSLPYSLSDIYPEVIKSFNQKLFILAATGIRAILEGICKDKKISKGKVLKEDGKEYISKNLEGRISGMLESGLINKQQFDVLHELRFLGNSAVHELEEPSFSDVKNALDVIEHIIDDIYELPIKSQNLKTRRERK